MAGKVPGHWVGWYANQGATLCYPASILWTRCGEGDSYAEALALLRAKAPPGRMLNVLLRGATPGRTKAGKAKKKRRSDPAIRRSYTRWDDREARILDRLGCGGWFSPREILESLGLPGTAQSTLQVLLNRLLAESRVERRRREGTTKGTLPMEYRRVT